MTKRQVAALGNQQKHCIACSSKIEANASLCATCHSYQKRWKNRLQYFANVVTLFVVSGSLIVWAGPKLWRSLFWHEDVRVVACNAPLGSAVIGNFGDGEVFVSHLMLFMVGRPKWEGKRIPIYKSLPPGQFMTQEIEPNNKLTVQFVDGLTSSQDWQKILQAALSSKECHRIAFFTLNDPFFQELRQAKNSIRTFDAGGYISYYAAGDSNQHIKSISVTGTVLRLIKDECK